MNQSERYQLSIDILGGINYLRPNSKDLSTGTSHTSIAAFSDPDDEPPTLQLGCYFKDYSSVSQMAVVAVALAHETLKL